MKHMTALRHALILLGVAARSAVRGALIPSKAVRPHAMPGS